MATEYTFAPASFTSTVLGSENWVVANRFTPRLREKYDARVSHRDMQKIHTMFRCGYTPEAARYELAA